MSSVRSVALKIDVDTYRGTREGIPAMLDDLASAGVRASFYFTLGPDRSGRAIFRVFRNRRFLQKMVRTNPFRMYGLRTALYGTLLPSPRIADKCADIIRRCRSEGHEVGLHAWDHVTWQDRLHRLSREEIEEQIRRGISAFEEVFGERPRSFAAPAWYCTPLGFEILDMVGFDYLSVARGQADPYYPSIGERVLQTIDVPTTLPTLDEQLGRDGITESNYVEKLTSSYRSGKTETLTVHAETEGLNFRRLFQQLLRWHREAGVVTVPVHQFVAECRTRAVPRPTRLGEIPGRSGRVVLVGGSQH